MQADGEAAKSLILESESGESLAAISGFITIEVKDMGQGGVISTFTVNFEFTGGDEDDATEDSEAETVASAQESQRNKMGNLF